MKTKLKCKSSTKPLYIKILTKSQKDRSLNSKWQNKNLT